MKGMFPYVELHSFAVRNCISSDRKVTLNRSRNRCRRKLSILITLKTFTRFNFAWFSKNLLGVIIFQFLFYFCLKYFILSPISMHSRIRPMLQTWILEICGFAWHAFSFQHSYYFSRLATYSVPVLRLSSIEHTNSTKITL